MNVETMSRRKWRKQKYKEKVKVDKKECMEKPMLGKKMEELTVEINE